MTATQVSPDLRSRGAAPPFVVAFRFAAPGDLRYLSHHDELRMLARICRRADLPLAFSRGFNPQPKARLPLPRPVGVGSQCEWAFIELTRPMSAADLAEKLRRAAPPGCEPLELIAPATRATPHARRVEYVVTLAADDVAGTCEAIAALLAAPRVETVRTYGPKRAARAVDIRPFVETLELDGRTLRMRVELRSGATARPSEVLTVLGLPAVKYAHRVERVQVEWDIEIAAPIEDAASERTNLGKGKDGEETRRDSTEENSEKET